MSRSKIDWDFRKFEAKMEKEILNRKMLGNCEMDSNFSELGILDQFFIFGLPPNSKKQAQPTVLAAFPPFVQSNIPVKNILSLSMPNWELNNSNSKAKFTNLFQTFDKNGPQVIENGIVDEFVFQFNAGATKMYGVCAHLQPSKANRNASLPFFASENTKKSVFCLCMISKLPIFNAHFTFLNYLVGLCTGTIISAQKKSCLINSLENAYENNYENNYRQDNEIQNDTLIEGFELAGAFGHIPQIDIPEEFQSKIFDYYSKTMYSSPSKLAPGYTIHFPPPSTPTSKLILWGALDTLFSVLSIADIIRLLTALILDAQVLIIGTSMEEVSMTVYGLVNLLTPFNYCGTVMPILPNDDDYLDLLSSPTPFIFGMPNIPKLKKMTFLESTYIVNIDKHKISQVDFYPKYPGFYDIVKNISNLVTKEANNSRKGDDLLDVSQNQRERSRSAIEVNDGPKQIRIKPSFARIDRRNNTAFSFANFDNEVSQKVENTLLSEKADDTSEKVENTLLSEKAEGYSIDEKVENATTSQINEKDNKEKEDEINEKADEAKKVKIHIANEDDKQFEIAKKADDEKKNETINKVDDVEKDETSNKLADEKKLENAEKLEIKVENIEKNEDKKRVEINENVENLEQPSNFPASQNGLIRRNCTFTPNNFPSIATNQNVVRPTHISPSFSLPLTRGPSSQPLQDFPVFKKPIFSNDIDSDPNPYKFPTDFTKKLNHKIFLNRENIDKILTALHEPLDFIFSDLLNCYFVTNALENVTIFNQSLFLASVKPEDLSFYEFLLESQTFQDYVETKLNEFTISKSKGRKAIYGPKTKRRVSTVRKLFNY